ncbi:Pleckstrin domain [Trinorchestia longiramus]|nr:Pleckstrin domain [Trinorchestia longiramus]
MSSNTGQSKGSASEECRPRLINRRVSCQTESPDSSDRESSEGEDDEASLRSMILGVPGMADSNVRTYIKRLKLFSDSESDDSGTESEPMSWDCELASDDSGAYGYYVPSDDSPDDTSTASQSVIIPGEARSIKLTPAKKPKDEEMIDKKCCKESPSKRSSVIETPSTRMFHILHSENFERHAFTPAPQDLTFPLELPSNDEKSVESDPMFGPELAPLNVAAARKIISLSLKPIINLKKAGRTLDKDDKIITKTAVGAIDKILRSGLGKEAKKSDQPPELPALEEHGGNSSTERHRLLSLLETISNLDHCSSSWPALSFVMEYTKQGVVHRDVLEEEQEFWEMWVRRHTESAILQEKYFQNLPLLVLLLQLLIGDGRVGSIAFESLLETISNLEHCSSSWPALSFVMEYTKQGVVHRDVLEEEQEFWEMWVRRHTESAIVQEKYFQNLPLLVLLLQLLIGDGRVGSIAFEKSPHLITASFVEMLCHLRQKNLFYITHLWLDGYKFDRARLFYTFMQVCASPELRSLHCRARKKNELLALSVFAYSVKKLMLFGKRRSLKSKKIRKYLMGLNNDNSSDSGRESSVGQRDGMIALRSVHLYEESGKDRSRILLRWAAKCHRIKHASSGGRPVRMIKSKKNRYKYNINELRLESLDFESFRKRSEYKRYGNLKELSFSDSNLWTKRHFKLFKVLMMKLKSRISGIHWTMEGRYSVKKVSEILNASLGISGRLTNLTLRMATGFNITDAIYVLSFFFAHLKKLTFVGPPVVNYAFTKENKKLFNYTFPNLEELTVRVNEEGDAENLQYFIRSLLLRSSNLKKLELHLSNKNMAEVSFYLPLYSLEHVETVVLKKTTSDQEEPQNWVTAVVRNIPSLKTLVILDKDLELLQHLRAWPMRVHNISVVCPRHYPELFNVGP